MTKPVNKYVKLFKKHHPGIANSDNFFVFEVLCDHFQENDEDLFDDLSVVKIIKLIVDSQLTFYREGPEVLTSVYKNLTEILYKENENGFDHIVKIYNEHLYPDGYSNNYTEALDAYLKFVVLGELYNSDDEPISIDNYDDALDMCEYVVCRAIIYFRSVIGLRIDDQETILKETRNLH